ncbi:MAG: hypothetical protein PHT58_07570 [Eubacteriales bacterium]|nr:hypothetical protein [Eubacteriales bacterium]
MKKTITIIIAALLLVCMAVPAAANTDAENKEKLLDTLKENLDMDTCLTIYNCIEKIINKEQVTVSDEQLSQLLAIDFAKELADVTDKGVKWSDYSDAEQASAINVATQICSIMGLTYRIDTANDPQQESNISVSIYKDGVFLGSIYADAKTDVAVSPSVWYLVGGGALVLLAVIVAVVVFRKRNVQTEV